MEQRTATLFSAMQVFEPARQANRGKAARSRYISKLPTSQHAKKPDTFSPIVAGLTRILVLSNISRADCQASRACL